MNSAGEAKRKDARRNRKGYDIGYGLATDSGEGVTGVEPRTVVAPDATTAFAVPNPSVSSQIRRFFRVRMPNESPRRADHPAYFGLANFSAPTLSAVDEREIKCRGH